MSWRPSHQPGQASLRCRVLLAVSKTAPVTSNQVVPTVNQMQQPQYKSLTHSATPAVGAVSAPEWLEVDSSKAARFVITHGHLLADTTPNQWHQVIVKTPVTDRNAVITAINKRISPLKLTPYFFRLENGCITFLVSNCCAQLTMLCKRDLKVPYNSDGYKEIELALRLCARKVNISDILQKIVTTRVDSEKKNLDLSYLTHIPEFQEVLFHPSNISDLLQQLIIVASVVTPNVVTLRLAGNELTSLGNLKNIFSDRAKWRSLKVLDLTDNKIKTLAELVIFYPVPVTELYLDQNPICGKYKEEHAYVSVIRVNFPRLVKLDGTYLHQTSGLPYWRPNFIVQGSHGDPGELADQFVEHFFTLYDGEDRMCLRGLYHDDAYFSVCSMYLPGQVTSVNARLTCYVTESRNLLRSTSKLKTRAALSRGAENVLKKLTKFPRTQHDFYSFTVDVLQHTAVSTVMTVTGVFREQGAKETISPRHFMRTFILVTLSNDEYKIVNDIMYVTNATTLEAEEAFRYTRIPTKLKKNRPPQRQLTEFDKESMCEIVSQLTGMSPVWSRKCLEDSEWDIKDGLQAFVELYKMNKIPKAAFVISKTQQATKI